ncbi:hypothetical protein [Breoghania sp.]|uniref:hypothetical protein n=1 Tax=Breoghania sp. TaxID=2065378 RepID=UPI002611EDA6|nr:hypothetical protein [Breoghania sp.]MDJ0931900.1 hypothetical protein [Breoghania sp.]
MQSLINEIESLEAVEVYGRVVGVQGLLVEVSGPVHEMSVGSRLSIEGGTSNHVLAEIVGFRDGRALCLPFSGLQGVRIGCRAVLAERESVVRMLDAWLGRVVNAMGEAINGKGRLSKGGEARQLRSSPPPATDRARVGGSIDLGVRALNTFVTCCRGQRMGIFAGSGVGKSVLLSMLARNTAHVGTQYGRRCGGDRADRRTRARGGGIRAERPGRRRPESRCGDRGHIG